MQSRPESNSPDYRFSTGAAILFTSARMMDWIGLTNISFYMDAGLFFLLAGRAARDLSAYGPAKALNETKQLGQNSVESVEKFKSSAISMFNDFRGAKKKPVENAQIEEVNFSASPVKK